MAVWHNMESNCDCCGRLRRCLISPAVFRLAKQKPQGSPRISTIARLSMEDFAIKACKDVWFEPSVSNLCRSGSRGWVCYPNCPLVRESGTSTRPGFLLIRNGSPSISERFSAPPSSGHLSNENLWAGPKWTIRRAGWKVHNMDTADGGGNRQISVSQYEILKWPRICYLFPTGLRPYPLHRPTMSCIETCTMQGLLKRTSNTEKENWLTDQTLSTLASPVMFHINTLTICLLGYTV